MEKWLGWLILLAAFAFAVFAFRKGISVKREDRSDQDGMPPVSPSDAAN